MKKIPDTEGASLENMRTKGILWLGCGVLVLFCAIEWVLVRNLAIACGGTWDSMYLRLPFGMYVYGGNWLWYVCACAFVLAVVLHRWNRLSKTLAVLYLIVSLIVCLLVYVALHFFLRRMVILN